MVGWYGIFYIVKYLDENGLSLIPDTLPHFPEVAEENI
jgi:hypothetical protein